MKTTTNTQKSERLQSLDALRGFDMLWIVGGQKIIYALAVMTGLSFFDWFHNQLKHMPWDGFALYDLIFPLFLFLSGVSIPFSFEKRLSKGGTKKDLYKHALERVLLLILFGLIYNGLFKLDFENQRYGSVLGRIGIAWFFGAVLYLNFNLKGMIYWAIGLLTTYTAFMLFFPVPSYGAGVLTLEGNFAGYVDRLFMPGKFYFEGKLEPEGIFSTLPAVVTALLGIFTGLFIKKNYTSSSNKYKAFIGLLIGGIIGLVLGKTIGLVIPINKWLWSTPFTFYTAGWSMLLLAIFHLLFDIWKLRKLGFFFVVIGMNPITIYLAQHKIIDFNVPRDFFFSGLMEVFPYLSPLISSIGYICCIWVFLYFLYHHKIFLKV